MQVIIESDPIAVREFLALVTAGPIIRSLKEGERCTAEIVLAEVLNNIVEHAYAEQPGVISIELVPHPIGVFVTVEDSGRAFPKDCLPEGHLPPIDSFETLPEGGYGWFLIRSQAQNLTYQRRDGRNYLSFCLPGAPDA